MKTLFVMRRQAFGLAGFLALPLACVVNAAPTPPTSAGQLQQELQRQRTPAVQSAKPAPLNAPAAPAKEPSDAGPAVRLTKLTITGNQVFDSATLIGVAGLKLNSDVHLADLQAAAERISAFYRQAGYLVARAYVPAQPVDQGEIRLAVLEGTLDGVRVSNHSRLSDARISRTLSHRMKTGEALQSAAANRDILLLQQLPGAGAVKADLAPGSAVGSTRIHATVEKGAWVDGQLALDNYGNSFSGEYRGSALLHFNNLAGIGDRLTFAATLAEENRLAYGRLAWDAPVGYDGLRLGAAYSHTQYELGDSFASLDAHGTANTSSVYLSYPWLLTPSTHVNVDASLEQRHLKDNMLGSTISNKTLNALVFAISGDFRDRALIAPAVTAWRFANTFGSLGLDRSSEQLDKASGADTRGSYAKFQLSLSRTQSLSAKGLSLYAAASGQWAGQNLDSSEKFFLGGPDGVRAYPQGEAGGDQGWLLTLALQYRIIEGLQLRVFHDNGGVTVNKKDYTAAGTGGNHRHLSANGFGLDGQWRGFSLSMDVAWRDVGKALSDADRKPRVWARFAWQF